MLIHLFIDTATFNHLSSNAISILLTILVNNQDTYQMSAPILQNSMINFCQTIYLPITDPEINLTEIELTASSYLTSGKSLSLGKCHCLASYHEHGLIKLLSFQNILTKEIIGNISLTLFYYQFPMDINNFRTDESGSDRIGDKRNRLKIQNQHFLREYLFLRSRSEHWKGNGRIQTWNYKTQSLLDQDESLKISHKLKKQEEERRERNERISSLSPGRRRRRREKQEEGGAAVREAREAHSSTSKKLPRRSFSSPKLRKTVMSVGYIGNGVTWPSENDHSTAISSSSNLSSSLPLSLPASLPSHLLTEKLQFKLYLAEERRLHLLKRSAELVKQKNSQMKIRHEVNLHERVRQSATEQQLRQLLALKERSIKRLEKRYLELKYSPPARGGGRGDETLRREKGEMRRRGSSGERGRDGQSRSEGKRSHLHHHQNKENKLLEKEIRKELKRHSGEGEGEEGVGKEKPRRSKSAGSMRVTHTRYDPERASPLSSSDLVQDDQNKTKNTRGEESIWEIFLGLSDPEENEEEEESRETHRGQSKVHFSQDQRVPSASVRSESLAQGKETRTEFREQSPGSVNSPSISPLGVDQLLARHSHEYGSFSPPSLCLTLVFTEWRG
jgi:hypothetical protein